MPSRVLDPATRCRTILASSVAKSLMMELQTATSKLNKTPTICAFLANNDPAAKTYAAYTRKACEEVGFSFNLVEVKKEVLQDEIHNANQNELIDGIMVYYPVFNSERDKALQASVSSLKDVEGLSPLLVSNIYQNIRLLGQPSILPCTPLAIIRLLKYAGVYDDRALGHDNRLSGKRITVINRSNAVGRPLAALLANDGAEVYSVDIDGVQRFYRGGLKTDAQGCRDMVACGLEQCLPISDIVISGVPSKEFKVPTDSIREGAICLNFSSEKNFDIDVKEKASIYMPSVGRVTIAMFLRNALRIAQHRPRGLSLYNIRDEKSILAPELASRLKPMQIAEALAA